MLASHRCRASARQLAKVKNQEAVQKLAQFADLRI
jgi:hypothetical protein